MEKISETEMPDSRRNRAGDDQELTYWSNEFGIGKDEIIAVVQQGGTITEAVEKYVKRMKFAL